MRGVRRLFFTVALIVSWPMVAQEGLRDRDPAIGATKRIAGDLQRASFRKDSFYLLSKFQLADIGVDQSFFAPTSDQSSGGVTFGVTAPQKFYYVPSKKVIFSADVNPSYSFLTKNRSGKRGQFGYLVRGDSHLLLNHLYLDTYVSRASQIRSNSGEINRLATLREDSIGINGELKYSSRTSSTFSAAARKSSYPTDQFQPSESDRAVRLLDRTEHNYRGAVLHRTFPLTSLLLAAERNDYSFSNAPVKNSNRSYGGAGMIFDNGRTVLKLEAGRAKLDFRAPGATDFSGPVGNAQASRRFGARWTANLGLARDLDFSIFQNNNYYLLDRASLTAVYVASRRLSLVFSSISGRDLYDVPVNGKLRRDTIHYESAGFRYTLRRVQTGLDVGYYSRSSNFAIDENNGLRFVVHLSFTP